MSHPFASWGRWKIYNRLHKLLICKKHFNDRGSTISERDREIRMDQTALLYDELILKSCGAGSL